MSSHLDPKVCPFLAQTGGPCPCMHPLGTGDEHCFFCEKEIAHFGKGVITCFAGALPLALDGRLAAKNVIFAAIYMNANRN